MKQWTTNDDLIKEFMKDKQFAKAYRLQKLYHGILLVIIKVLRNIRAII